MSASDRNDPDTGWDLLPHDADLRVLGWGPTTEAAFEQAAIALTAAVTDAAVERKEAVRVTCEGNDVELLFVEWLNAIVYEMATRGMLFGAFEVAINGTRLEGTLWGEPADQRRHRPACEPKGATYTALSVSPNAEGRWSASCVVDV